MPKALQEQKALQAQAQLLEHDCQRLANPDYTRPFSSIDDAVDRLLPYHVRGRGPGALRLQPGPILSCSLALALNLHPSSALPHSRMLRTTLQGRQSLGGLVLSFSRQLLLGPLPAPPLPKCTHS